MLHERLVFALCTSRIHDPEVLESVRHFTDEAHRRGYAVLIFNSSLDQNPNSLHEQSCYSVFDLIPCRIVDMIVIMSDAIANRVVTNTIAAFAKEHHIPILCYDGRMENVPSLYSYTAYAFDALLDHVFGKHHCQRVDLMIGTRSSSEAETALASYKETLCRYDLAFDEKRVEYDCRGEEAVKEAVDRLLALDTPDAIICTDDRTAIIVCSVLRSHGLRIPEDVIVTGSNNISIEHLYIPRLTTCIKDYEKLCAAFFDTAELILDGGNVSLDIEIKPLLRISESCGCHITEHRDQNDDIHELNRKLQICMRQESEEHWVLGALLERQQPTVIDYLDVISGCIPENSYLCLRDSLSPDLPESSLHQFADPSELMSTVMHKQKEKQFSIIPRASLIPVLEQVLDAGKAILFNSIYMQDEVYGYSAFYGDDLSTATFMLPRFIHTAGNVIGSCLATSRLQAMNERLVDARVRDSLTGMLNLHGAIKALNERLHSEKHENERFIIIVIGLNHLRRINSIFGRAEGDQALLSLASAITDCIDSNVTAARIGGDEFMIAFFEAENQTNTSEALISVLQQRMHSYNQVSGKNYSLDISFGRVCADIDSALSLDTMLNEAITIKEAQRASGSESIDKSAMTDAEAAQMERVLNENLLTYHFQPIVNAKTGQIFAYEALMRTSGGIKISPLTLLSYATLSGRLYEVEWLTYNNVLKYISANREAFADKRIFINSIPGHFLNETDFLKLRERYGDILPQLVVEFTEQAETEGEELSMIQARCARNHMAIAVDDYGTGYSNISNLLRYSPNYVKIDRSLLSSIHEEPKKQHFVTNIIEFAHANGFMALAEGVETVEELRAVIRFGVDLIQGNFTSLPNAVPIPAIPDRIETMIAKFSASAEKQIMQKTYMLGEGENTVHLPQLDAEHFTDLFVAQPYLEVIGDFHETSGVHIKIKDDTDCHILLRDAHFNLPQQIVAPAIMLGKNSNVVLEFQGDNRMDNGGILVPETSSLHLTGTGNLSIRADNTKAFAIGNDPDLACGEISIDLAGILTILSNAGQCVGIGCGYGKGQTISVTGTRMFFEMTGRNGVGIGTHEGNAAISLSGCEVDFSVRMGSSVAIGCMEGAPDIRCNTTSISIVGSGTFVCGIGSETGGGSIALCDSAVSQEFTGQNAIGIGSGDSAPNISLRQCSAAMHLEGNHAMDIGSFSEDAALTILDSTFQIDILSAKAQHFSANPACFVQTGNSCEVSINR